MREDHPTQGWRLLEPLRILAGYAYGSRYPTVMCTFMGQALDFEQRNVLKQWCMQQIPLDSDVYGGIGTTLAQDDWRETVMLCLATFYRMQRGAGLPVYEQGRVLGIRPGQARVLIPCTLTSATTMQAVVKWWLAELARYQTSALSHTLGEQWRDVLSHLQALSPGGMNTVQCIQAAYQNDIPFYELPAQVVQYGQGRHSRWLNSTFTDATSQISVSLARNKQLTALLLRQAGIPVPDHIAVADEAGALAAAEKLGYPVVVKPADQERGMGVAAGLHDANAVREAFARACEYSKHILVEQHVAGRDHRLLVHEGTLLWVVERIPGGVTGDGVSTIAQLVAKLNTDPLRGSGPRALLKTLTLDTEAERLLSIAGLNTESVLASGQFFALRSIANTAAGGTVVAAYDRIHPDNAELAIRTAQALRLDLAGIDLLIPDIAHSWRETGAYVCEVNAQPQITNITNPHLYRLLLKHLIPNHGRIPTVLVLGATPEQSLVTILETALHDRGYITGVFDRGKVRVGKHTPNDHPVDLLTAGQRLLRDRSVDALVLAVNDATILSSGLPLARFDVLLLAGLNITLSEPWDNMSLNAVFKEILSVVVPACEKCVLTLADAGINLNLEPGVTLASSQQVASHPEALLETLFKVLEIPQHTDTQ